MTISVADFRHNFPAFASTSTFEAGQVQFWLDFTYSMLNAPRWGSQLDMGAQLYVAHNLILEAKAAAAGAGGGIPGGDVGVVSSKSVDKVSVGLDVGAGTEAGAGHWNLTIYGTRFFRLVKMFGAGPIQIGIGASPVGATGAAWAGPDVTPGFTTFG